MSDELRYESIHAIESRGHDLRIRRQQLHVMQNDLHRPLLRDGHEGAQRGELLLEGGAFDEQQLHEAGEVPGEGQSV